jgi:hypothetical protein
MPYTMQWFVECRIVQATVQGKFRLEEIREISQSAVQFFEKGTAPIHIVVDITDLELVEFELNLIAQVGMSLKHPALGWWIVYGNENLMYYYVRTIAGLMRVRFAFTQTLEQAISILKQQDRSL